MSVIPLPRPFVALARTCTDDELVMLMKVFSHELVGRFRNRQAAIPTITPNGDPPLHELLARNRPLPPPMDRPDLYEMLTDRRPLPPPVEAADVLTIYQEPVTKVLGATIPTERLRGMFQEQKLANVIPMRRRTDAGGKKR